MTKKHLQAIANGLKELQPLLVTTKTKVYQAERNLWVRTIITMADICNQSNPNFNRYRFYSACGYDYTKNE